MEETHALLTPSLSALSSPETLQQQKGSEGGVNPRTAAAVRSEGTTTSKTVSLFTRVTTDQNPLYWQYHCWLLHKPTTSKTTHKTHLIQSLCLIQSVKNKLTQQPITAEHTVKCPSLPPFLGPIHSINRVE